MRAKHLVSVAIGLFAACLATSGWATEAALPEDVDGFTRAVAEKFRAALPQAQVTIEGPLTLMVSPPGKPSGTHTNLDRMWKFCQNNADRCVGALDDFVGRMAETATQVAPPPEPAAIRIVVRPTRDLEATLLQIRQASPDKPMPITGRLSGDMSWMMVLDMPQAVHSMSAHDLAKLGLTQDQAYVRGLANLAGELKPFAGAAPLPAGGRIGVISGNYYESSRLLLHDAWKDLADRMVGPLLVAVPGANIVLYGDGGWPNMQADLAAAAHRAALQNEKPLSTQLLKWTAAGWEPVTP